MKRLPEGLYEQVINHYIQNKKSANQQFETVSLNKFEDVPALFAQYISSIIRKSFTILGEKNEDLTIQIDHCNEIIRQLSAWTSEEFLTGCEITPEGKILLSVLDPQVSGIKSVTVSRPLTSLSHSSLFTGSREEPSLLQELKAEIASADRIDMLVSFIKWSGIRLLMENFTNFCNHGTLRIITTSYIGATDLKAIEFLSSLRNTEIRISYDTEEQDFMQKPTISTENQVFRQHISVLRISLIQR